MQRTAVLNVVGLTPRLLERMDRLRALGRDGAVTPIQTITPAVTCPVQSTMLTGALPAQHGVVANGWYDRGSAEVRFWRQSNGLVGSEKIWEAAKRRDPSFTCANLFWWFNMYSSVDIALTPRPMYPADGPKIPDLWTTPTVLRDELQQELGRFPLFKFWGPAAGIESSEWIARSAKRIEERFSPTLSLVYLPHLDYNLQRLGPNDPKLDADGREVDELAGDLVEFYASRGVQTIVLSEYGVTDVAHPVSINRALRQEGLLAVRTELGRELLDAGASRAFAVADHQIAHLYINDPAALGAVRRLVVSLSGVERVLDAEGKRDHGLDHPRSGELVAISDPEAWFTYDYWLDEARAPDFARTVDIHRKPGYDPRELFLDPTMVAPKAQIAWKLVRKKLGFRTLFDVIPLDASLVKGSHGRPTDDPADGPVLIAPQTDLLQSDPITAVDVRDVILRLLFGD